MKSTFSLFFLIVIGSKLFSIETNKSIDSINDLSMSFAETDATKSMFFANQAIKLSEQQHYLTGKAKAYNCIGIVYDVAGNYDSSIYYYNKGLQIAKEAKNNKVTAAITNNIGMIHWNKGEYEIALQKYFDSYKLYVQEKNEKGQANTLSNIGLIYADIHKDKEAMEYCEQALTIREKINDEYGLSISYTNLASLYSNLNEVNKSIAFNQKSIDIKTKVKDDYGIAINLNNMANEHARLKQYEKALALNFDAEKIRIKIDDKFGLCTTYEAIGHVFSKLKNNKKSIDYLKKAESIAVELDSKSKLKDIYLGLAENYKEIKQFEEAIQYFERHDALKDSIFSTESNDAFAKLHVQYETEKKSKEIAKQQLEIKNRNFLLVGLFSLLLIASLLFYLIYSKNKAKQEKQLQLERLKEQEQRAKVILETEENERQRLARELHDGVGQLLTATKLNLSNLKNTENATASIQHSMNILDESIQEIRNISHNMVPDVLLRFGLVKAVEEFIKKIKNQSTAINFESTNFDATCLDETSQLMLYRIIQESVNNAIKYADATTINVQLTSDEDELTLLIEDNGKGFDMDAMLQKNGIGMKNMKLRSEFLKGHLTIDSSLGNGTTIIVDIPINKTSSI